MGFLSFNGPSWTAKALMIATRGRGDTGTRGKSRPSPRLRVPLSPRPLLSPLHLLRRKHGPFRTADDERLLDPRDHAAQTRSEAASHLRLGGKLRRQAKAGGDRREGREHRHRTAGVELRVSARLRATAEKIGHPSSLPRRSVV